MKILFVAPRYHTNQVEIVRALQDRGHEVRFHVVLYGPTEDHDLLEPEVIAESPISVLIRRVFGDGGVNRKRFFPRVSWYWRRFRKFAPDVVIIRVHNKLFSFLAALFARLTGAKIVLYSQRSSDFIDEGRISHVVKYDLPSRIFGAVWMTPLLARRHEPCELPDNYYYVPFAVPIHNTPKNAHHPLRFLSVGKFEPRKNYLVLIQAVADLISQFEFTVTLVGEMATPEHRVHFQTVRDRIGVLGLEDVIKTRTNVPYREIERVYREHDIFVLPARDEPASISVLEAMGHGMPVICSDTCGTKCYVRQGATGFIIESDSVHSLRSRLEWFLQQPTRTQTMARTVREYAERSLSAENYYEHFSKMIDGERESECSAHSHDS